MEYPTSRHDVYHVAFLLRQKLVADLVPIVLDEAQYWTRRHVSTEKFNTVSDAPEGRRILRTAALTAEEHRRVRLVRFATRSAAQCFDRSIWDRPQSPSCSNCGEQQQRQRQVSHEGVAGAADTAGATGDFSNSISGDLVADWAASDAWDTQSVNSVASSTASAESHDPPRSLSVSSSASSASSVSLSSLPSTPHSAASASSPCPSYFEHVGCVSDAHADTNKDGAFTWFEAHVVPAAAPDHMYPDHSHRLHTGMDAIMRPGAPAADSPARGPRLVSNCNTEELPRDYEAVWRFNSADRAERAFVRGIAAGDCVDLTAHADVFGWENYCKHAEIEIFFGHVRV